MLNAGLSTLTYLKSRILPAAAVADTTWDAALMRLGLAVAAKMEQHCARQFARTVGAVDEFRARCLSIVTPRYPVEAITALQIRDTDGAVAACTAGYSLDKAAGLLEFSGAPGSASERLVVTYTGGYWLDPLTTPATALPAGATPLPEDLLELWVSEVQMAAEERGVFEAAGLRAPKDRDKAKASSGLSDDTVAGLRTYRRFAGE